jgi:pimeloyl-ACP methyl ester carboxylesterase
LSAVLCAAVLSGCGTPIALDMDGSHYTPVGTPAAAVKLHTEERGKGEPILLLHGFGASTYTWRYIRNDLARTHRVIAVDMKGFGRSDKPLDTAYSPLDQARQIADLVQQRDLRRLTLVGHSYGGAVALAAALMLEKEKPGRVERLIILDGAAYQQGLPPALHVLRTPFLGPLSAAVVPPEVQSNAALYFAYKDPSKYSEADVKAYARPMYEEGNRHALVQTAQQIIPEHVNILTHEFRRLRMPALLIWCRGDKIVPLAVGKRLVRELPNAHLEIIETCGHIPHEEEPGKALELIRPFLQGTGFPKELRDR